MRLESSFSAYVLDPLMRYHSTNLALQDASDNTHKWRKSGSERAILDMCHGKMPILYAWTCSGLKRELN